MKNQLLGISIQPLTKKEILEKIKKYILLTESFAHVVSLNPENVVLANEAKDFMEVIRAAQIRIIDGVGIVLAGQILNIDVGERLTGVDLMSDLVKEASRMRLRVVLIGGEANLAERLADCYNRAYPEAKFIGLQAIKKIKNPKKEEEDKLFSIVAEYKPHLLFAAFGSPDQELWLYRNRAYLKGVVCMGVGGAFEFLGHEIRRAPARIRIIGLEWLFRLILQPWRWRRQLRLIKFMWLVVKERLRLS